MIDDKLFPHFMHSLLLGLDVDTDLYKLIMSPQYLTTEHIQVTHNFTRVVINCLHIIHPTHSCFVNSVLDLSISNASWTQVYSFILSDS